MAQYDKKHLRAALLLPLATCLVVIVLHIIRTVLFIPARPFSVLPRSIAFLPGILTSPFIHGGYGHLFSNILPLFAGLGVILLFYRKVAIRSILLIYFITGGLVWLFAREVFHIGASGVVYGLISFIFWSGVFRRSLKAIMLALIVIMLYSGMLIGLFPIEEGVSWESHLFGVVAGMIVAYLYRHDKEPDEIKQPYEWETLEEEKKPFFEEGTFEDSPYYTKDKPNIFDQDQ